MYRFCYSCGAPLEVPDFKGPAEDYCRYCTDEKGTVKSRAEIQRGVAEWFESWQSNLDDEKALARAENYYEGDGCLGGIPARFFISP